MTDWIESHLAHIAVGLVVAMVLLGVALVVPHHEQVVAPDGKPAWLVTCSGPGGCISESSELCPGGYQVISQTAERGQVTSYTNVGTGSGSSIVIPVTSETYSGATLIRCLRGAQ